MCSTAYKPLATIKSTLVRIVVMKYERTVIERKENLWTIPPTKIGARIVPCRAAPRPFCGKILRVLPLTSLRIDK